MEDFIPFIIFVALALINIISKAKEAGKGSFKPMPLKKTKPQTLNRRPIKAGKPTKQYINNAYQYNISTETDITDKNICEEPIIAEEVQSNHSEQDKAKEQVQQKIIHTQSKASLFADFIQREGQNAIILGEILGKPKGLEEK